MENWNVVIGEPESDARIRETDDYKHAVHSLKQIDHWEREIRRMEKRIEKAREQIKQLDSSIELLPAPARVLARLDTLLYRLRDDDEKTEERTSDDRLECGSTDEESFPWPPKPRLQ